ncbi:MAG: hypothetical protein J6Z45_00540 [Oscillospiraceae bacterium]|nr:hypothetical protein [Oscillospiraceae bacterium]
MANIFGRRHDDLPDDKISVSDIGTDVLISVLVLAGSALAETESQKQLIVWLAEHDQYIGSGIVGFDLSDMPWDPAHFDEDRMFMVRTVDAASVRTGWDKLSYAPSEPHLRPMLGWFHKAFLRLKREDIVPQARENWFGEMEPDDPALNGFPRCEKHGCFLTYLGCQVCHGRN